MEGLVSRQNRVISLRFYMRGYVFFFFLMVNNYFLVVFLDAER